MKKTILNLIHSSKDNQKSVQSIEKIFSLYEQLQYASNIEQLASDTFDWLNKEFKVDNLIFSLFNIDTNSKENVFIKGKEFYLDDELSFFFIINTHTNQNAIISFNAASKTQYKIIQDSYESIESAFFLISPIIQSRLLKRNFIKAQSIDSVTNVHNRQYLTKHINKQLHFSDNKPDKIFFLMVGVDRFKAIVEEFNYDIADKVLINLANTIHSNISEIDMVARITGDEFIISIQSTNNENDITSICNKIIEEFSKTKVVVNNNGQTLQKTICIGFDCLDVNSDFEMEQTIKNADIALIEAKNKGRSEFVQYKDIDSAIELF